MSSVESQRLRRLAVALLGAVVLGGCATAPQAPATPPETGREPDREEPAPLRRTVRIGVITSAGAPGVLGEYSSLVLDGARVAAAAASDERLLVELVLRDDRGTAAGAAAAIRELAAAGVSAVVGPLIDDGLSAAASARTGDLPLVSPTATVDPAGVSGVWALNVVDTRGAAELGRYARRYSRVGVLHSSSVEGRQQQQAFETAFGDAGTLRSAAFPASVGNIAPLLRQMQQARVQALFIQGSERELQLLLPQIEYSALRDVQLLGGENWLANGGRGLPARVVDGAVIALPLFRESDAVGWQDFVRQYEAMHRRVIDNAIPALGYDAVMLALRAATGGSMEVREYRGASGVLTLSNDAITRRPFLVRRDGTRLIPVN